MVTSILERPEGVVSPAEQRAQAAGRRPLLTMREVAEYLNVGRSTAYLMAQRGEIPVIRLGGTLVRVPIDALDAWLQQQTRQPTTTTSSL